MIERQLSVMAALCTKIESEKKSVFAQLSSLEWYWNSRKTVDNSEKKLLIQIALVECCEYRVQFKNLKRCVRYCGHIIGDSIRWRQNIVSEYSLFA